MKKLLFPLLIALGLLFAGCGDDNGTDGNGNGPVGPIRVVVDTTVTAPTLSDVNEAVWSNVTGTNIEIGGSTTYGKNDNLATQNVLFKAIKKLDTLYIWVRWHDASAGLLGNHFKKTDIQYIWEHVTMIGEDVFAILFDAGDNGDEGADCATMCHVNEMKTTGGGHADAWKWMSTRTSGARMAEDQWWTADTADRDATINLYVYRDNNDNAIPGFMHPDTFDFTGYFLYYDVAIDFDNFGIDWPTGYIMPGWVLDSTIFNNPERANTSMNDVKAISHFDSLTTELSDRTWTVVFARALNTGHADDVNLAALDSVEVTIAATHNDTQADVEPHSGSEPFWLILKP